MNLRRSARHGVVLGIVLALASATTSARAEATIDWMATVDEATAKVPGLRADRARAIAWLAVFNALNAIEPRYRSYPPAPPPWPAGAPRASADAAIAAAIYTALAVEPEADHALLARRQRETLAAVQSRIEREDGAILGRQAALMLLAARSGDRLEREEAPPRDAAVGVFVAPRDAKSPRSIQAMRLQPFGIRSVAALDPGPPPPVRSDAAVRENEAVRLLGGNKSSARSADQTAAALFWISSEAGDYSALVQRALAARKLAPLDVARVAALDAIVSIDSAIVGTAMKERYLRWRPETAIAGELASPRDAAWQPLVPAPPSPEYPSTGAISAGLLEVELPRLFGLDGAVAMTNGRTQQTRQWPSAAALADEFADSRIWAGAHFQSSIDAGRRIGRQLATEVLAEQLQPR